MVRAPRWARPALPSHLVPGWARCAPGRAEPVCQAEGERATIIEQPRRSQRATNYQKPIAVQRPLLALSPRL